MMNIVSRLFARGGPAFSEARLADAAAIAAVHGASFQRGWGEDEIYRLLIESNIVAHRATYGGKLIGFILSRRAAGEAETLSVATARPGAGAACHGRCSTCICGDWPALACTRCSWKSVNKM